MKKIAMILSCALIIVLPALAAPRQSQYLNPALSVSLITEKSIYRLGEPIKMILVATNASDRTFKAVFSSAKRYDFAAYDSDGNLVWRWSAGQMFAQAITPLELEPGEEVIFNADWQQQDSEGAPVLDGDYTLKGAILYQAGVNSATRKIAVVE